MYICRHSNATYPGALGVALKSVKGRAQAGVPDQTLAVEVERHNMGRKLDVVARRLHIDTANFEVTTVRALPPLEVVATERIVGIDSEAERSRVDIRIGVPDLESLLGVRHVLPGDGSDDAAAEDVVRGVHFVALTLILGRGKFDRLGQNVKGGQFALGIFQGDAEEIVGRLDFGRCGSVVLGGRACCAGIGVSSSGCLHCLAGSHGTECVTRFDQQSQTGERDKKGRLHLRVGCSDVIITGRLLRGSVLCWPMSQQSHFERAATLFSSLFLVFIRIQRSS